MLKEQVRERMRRVSLVNGRSRQSQEERLQEEQFNFLAAAQQEAKDRVKSDDVGTSLPMKRRRIAKEPSPELDRMAISILYPSNKFS